MSMVTNTNQWKWRQICTVSVNCTRTVDWVVWTVRSGVAWLESNLIQSSYQWLSFCICTLLYGDLKQETRKYYIRGWMIEKSLWHMLPRQNQMVMPKEAEEGRAGERKDSSILLQVIFIQLQKEGLPDRHRCTTPACGEITLGCQI